MTAVKWGGLAQHNPTLSFQIILSDYGLRPNPTYDAALRIAGKMLNVQKVRFRLSRLARLVYGTFNLAIREPT